MIRKTIITLLTLATVGCGAAWLYAADNMIIRTVLETDERHCAIWTHRYRMALVCSFELRSVGPFDDMRVQYDTPPRSPLPPFLSRTFFVERTTGSGEEVTYIESRYWFLMILFAAYPAIESVRGPLRRLRHRKGFCFRCGYNLTGNVSGICPECGTTIETG